MRTTRGIKEIFDTIFDEDVEKISFEPSEDKILCVLAGILKPNTVQELKNKNLKVRETKFTNETVIYKNDSEVFGKLEMCFTVLLNKHSLIIGTNEFQDLVITIKDQPPTLNHHQIKLLTEMGYVIEFTPTEVTILIDME